MLSSYCVEFAALNDTCWHLFIRSSWTKKDNFVRVDKKFSTTSVDALRLYEVS